MTTPSSGTVRVLGVLVDPACLSQQIVPSTETVHEAIQSLWRTISDQVDKEFMPETTRPSVTQVLLGEVDPFTHFEILTGFHGYQSHV